METEKDYLQSRKFILIPTDPILDFGTVEPGEIVASKSFVVDMIADKEGVIDCAADWINIEPKNFRKGRTTVTVQLSKEHLRRGEQHQARIKVKVGEESETVEVKVQVRRYSEKEIADMEAKLAALEQQVNALQQQNQQLQQQMTDFQKQMQQFPEVQLQEIQQLQETMSALTQKVSALEEQFHTFSQATEGAFNAQELGELEVAPIAEIDNLRATNFGEQVHLTWDWPDECNEVIVVRASCEPSWDGEDVLLGPEVRRRYTRAQYEQQAAMYDDVGAAIREYFYRVHTVGWQGSQKVMSPARQSGTHTKVVGGVLPTIKYNLSKRRGKVFVTCEASQREILEFVSLALRKKQNSPPQDATDGIEVDRWSQGQKAKKRIELKDEQPALDGIWHYRLFIDGTAKEFVKIEPPPSTHLIA